MAILDIIEKQLLQKHIDGHFPHRYSTHIVLPLEEDFNI